MHKMTNEIDCQKARSSLGSENFFESELLNGQAILDEKISLRNEIDYRLSRRGRVLILNYVEFNTSPRRQGSEKDVTSLKNMFQYLRFDDVTVHDNLTVGETYTVLMQERRKDHSENDCLVLFILSHGENDGFHCRDGIVQYYHLFESFSGERCPSLISKPKLIFLQCCRGERYDKGGLVYDDISGRQGLRLPITADLFVFYATFHDFYAWRNPVNGSWFVQELVKIVQEYGSKYDLLTLATLTCRAVAFERESRVAGDFEKDKKKQMPTFMSTLTKRLFFFND